MKGAMRIFGLTVACLLFCFFAVGCPPEGKPLIDEFVLEFDIISAKNPIQGAAWKTSKATSVELVLVNSEGKTVMSKTVGAASSGMHNWKLDKAAEDGYELQIVATNSVGKTRDSRKFLLVGERGKWYDFEKTVNRPGERAWYGFKDQQVLVTGTQGLGNQDEVISVAEGVRFSHIKWAPKMLQWADREGCTSAGLYTMSIAQLSKPVSFDKEEAYLFPSSWSTNGTYRCTVDWSPCNFGVQGPEITYRTVTFILSLKAKQPG